MSKTTTVGEVKAIVERIQEAFALAGATGPASDFKRLASALAGHEEETIDQFVDETLALLSLARADRKPAQGAKSSPAIEQHVRRLFAAGENKTDFEAAMTRLKEDQAIRKADLDAIANRFLNEPTGGNHLFQFKNADAAYRAIRRMFVDRAQDESKARIIKRMTG
jgi:hypothetical protein